MNSVVGLGDLSSSVDLWRMVKWLKVLVCNLQSAKNIFGKEIIRFSVLYKVGSRLSSPIV